MIIGTLAGAATLGLMIPPSLTLIVYGVSINESITKLFMYMRNTWSYFILYYSCFICFWYFYFPNERPARKINWDKTNDF